MNRKKQTRLLYLYEAILCFRMVDVVWVIFLLGRGFSLAEVGIAEGVYHVTSMVCEVPSGMAADLFGRKRTLVFSGIAGMCSGIFLSLDSWRGFVYIGMLFSALCLNLASGTEEAITYDSLLEAGCPEQYKTVCANQSVIGRVCSSVSCMFSPVALTLGYRYTYIISVLLHLCGICTVLGMKEPTVTQLQKDRSAQELTGIGRRLQRHVADTFTFIWKHPRTMAKLFANAGVACPCYLIMMYLQEHLVECGWPAEWIGIPMLLIPLAGALGSWAAARNRSRLFRIVTMCGMLGGFGTCFAGSHMLAVAIAGACAVRVCEGFVSVLISDRVNRDFNSDQRATLISVDSMLYSVMMVAASPLTGYLGSRYGVQVIFYVLGAGMMAATVLFGCIYTALVVHFEASQTSVDRPS